MTNLIEVIKANKKAIIKGTLVLGGLALAATATMLGMKEEIELDEDIIEGEYEIVNDSVETTEE